MSARAKPRAPLPRSAILRIALVLACLAGLASASAHSHLSASTPADGTTVTAAPIAVELDFTEPVQAAYSLFEALPLPVPFAAGETAPQLSARVHDLASHLSDEVLAKKVDAKTRVDTGVAPSRGTTDTVDVKLQDGLQAGYYVIVWRVLSEDGHVTHGVVVFRVRPGT